MKSFLLTFLCCTALGLARSPAAAAAPAAPAPTAWTGDRQLEELSRLLSSHFNCDGELQLSFLRPWTPPAAAGSTWEVEVLEFPLTPSANMLVRYRLHRDGAVADESTLLLRAALWRDAWYAREPIRTGTIFSADLLEARRIDAFREHDSLPISAGNNTYMFTRDLASDRLVTWHDLGRRPLVHKGEVVEVIAGEGSLSLTMKALCLENGARGDLVTVRNLESLKNISAQVIGDSRVEVRF